MAAGVMNLAMMKKRTALSDLRTLLTKPCWKCGGSGWVCVSHTLRPLGHDNCVAGGKPCRCNPEGLSLRDESDWATGRK